MNIKMIKKVLFLNMLLVVSLRGMEQGSAGMPLACLQKSCSLSSVACKLSKENLSDHILFAMGIDCHAIRQAESIPFHSICTSKLLEQTSKVQLLFEEAEPLLKDNDPQVFGAYIDIYNKLLRGTDGSNGLLWSDHSNEQIKKSAVELFYERADELKSFAELLQGIKKTRANGQFCAEEKKEEPRMPSHSSRQSTLMARDAFHNLSREAMSKLTTVAELINFIELPTLVCHSYDVCRKQLDEICERFRQSKSIDCFNTEIQSFLELAKSLPSEISKKFAKSVIDNHPAKEWLMGQCKIPSETCSEEKWNSHYAIVPEQCTCVPLPVAPSAAPGTYQLTHNNPVDCRKFSPDNRYFFILDRAYLNHTYKPCVNICDAQTENCLVKRIYFDYCPSSIVFSPDSCFLTISSEKKVSGIYEVQSGRLVKSFEDEANGSADGRYVSYIEKYAKGCSSVKRFKLYKVETGESISLIDDTGGRDQIIFSPESRYCIFINEAKSEGANFFSICPDKTIKVDITLFDIQAEKIICTLKNIEIYDSSNLESYNLAFSRDGYHLCSKEKRPYESGFRRQRGDGSNSNVMAKVYDLRNIFELERSFSEGLTLEQAATLISIYENQLHDDSFQCPESLAGHFRSFPENVRKMLRYYRPE